MISKKKTFDNIGIFSIIDQLSKWNAPHAIVQYIFHFIANRKIIVMILFIMMIFKSTSYSQRHHTMFITVSIQKIEQNFEKKLKFYKNQLRHHHQKQQYKNPQIDCQGTAPNILLKYIKQFIFAENRTPHQI